ncbi:hypothetical protein KJY73_16525 [Bowmanella sp. Y26]|uniref:hypothetical protein n=1 Tax=Bowmanella yangjiangensis TaxID=2811230 RepID=UPI001BDCBACB|nr:hypothetical protein [Bowmanella yangjiangensis]MBT1065197.1 hypothetical protein [Bowmanella yangjiangensis]
MLRKPLIYLFTLLWLTGCAVYPTSRTYFEPNPEDGTPRSSSSCGYNAAKNDSLLREYENFELSVTPHYKEGEDLQVTVLVQSKEKNVIINTSKIELFSSLNEGVVLALEANKTYYEPRSNWPYHMEWHHIIYPAKSESLNSFSIIFNSGSILLNGQAIEIKEFRFNKTKKNDIYYASINC